jgi:RNA polymerase sigma-70 factor, ECF subfamily
LAIRADDVDLDRDAALVERFQTGDEEAFADLYRRYFPRLRRYCVRRLGDPHEAEEAAQEALARAYRALPNLGGDRRFYPWLRVIASNLCADIGKRKPLAPLAEPGGGDVVVESLFEVLDQEQVRAALEGLTPRHQTALSLWAEGYPSKHIADELGCSRGAVDVTLHRARQSFRRRFLALSGDDGDRFGAFAGLAFLPALTRWAQRWRARVSTRVAEHSDLVSPLAAKVAASAFAISVVGGAVGAAPAHGRAEAVQPAARPTLSAPAQQGGLTSSTAVAALGYASGQSSLGGGRAQGAASANQSQPGALPRTRFMSPSQAQREEQNAPIHVEAAGAGFSVDPQPVVDGVAGMTNLRRSQ